MLGPERHESTPGTSHGIAPSASPQCAGLVLAQQERDARRAAQLALVQEWRRTLERAGYSTLLGLAAPLGILVSSPDVDDRQLVLRPSGLLVVLRQGGDGAVDSEFQLLERREGDLAGPAAEVALSAAERILGRVGLSRGAAAHA